MSDWRLKMISVAFSMLLLAGCASSPKAPSAERPAWIDNPGNGVSASAGMHIRGRVAQEELAVLRAREEYAKRYGVSIQASQTVNTSVANGRVSSVSNENTREDMKQVDVKAVVKAKWLDTENDVLWVWLVPSE